MKNNNLFGIVLVLVLLMTVGCVSNGPNAGAVGQVAGGSVRTVRGPSEPTQAQEVLPVAPAARLNPFDESETLRDPIPKIIEQMEGAQGVEDWAYNAQSVVEVSQYP